MLKAGILQCSPFWGFFAFKKWKRYTGLYAYCQILCMIINLETITSSFFVEYRHIVSRKTDKQYTTKPILLKGPLFKYKVKVWKADIDLFMVCLSCVYRTDVL